MDISARVGLVRKLKEERDQFASQLGSLDKFLTQVREERCVMNRDTKAYMSGEHLHGFMDTTPVVTYFGNEPVQRTQAGSKSKRLSYQGRQLLVSMEKELWEMDLEIVRLSKQVLGETKVPTMTHQCCLPRADCPQAPKQEKSTVTQSADIACRDHVKTLTGPQKTHGSIVVESKKSPKIQKPQTDIYTLLVRQPLVGAREFTNLVMKSLIATLKQEERDRFGFELSQLEKILMEMRKNRISFNKQMKLLFNDVGALTKVTQGTRLNSIKTKVMTYRNQSKRLSYDGRQLLESMQYDLWDMDLQIIRARGHCNKEALPLWGCLQHPDGPPLTSDNKVMASSTTYASATVRPSKKRMATSSTSCSRKVLKRPVSAPCLFKRAKKRKGMMMVCCANIASSSIDKPGTPGNQVLVRPTKKETMETDTSQEASHDTASVIHVHQKQKQVHSTSTSFISQGSFMKPENTMPAVHVKLTKRKKVPSTNSNCICFEGILENLESTVNSNQVSLTLNEAFLTASNESLIFSECTFRKTDNTTPAAHVELIQEEPLTDPTNPSHSFCSSDELEKSSSSASQVKLTKKLSADCNTYEIMRRARTSTLLTSQSTKMSSASCSIPGFLPTSVVVDGHRLTPVTMTDADVWNGTAMKTQVRCSADPRQRSVTAGLSTSSHRNIGLKEAHTILEILKMQRDLLVTSVCGIQSELDLGKQEDCIWRSRMDELYTELQQIKRCPNRHRVASIRAKAAYLKVKMLNLQLLGNVYLHNMDSVISHLTGEIRGVSCKIMAASPFNIDVNISSRD